MQDVVGDRMREQREALGLTQQQLGQRLEPLLGKSWSRQAVSAAENGERSFIAAELVALAVALQVQVGDLLRPPVEQSAADLGGPQALPRSELLAVTTSVVRDDMNRAEIENSVTALVEALTDSQDGIERALRLARYLDVLITARVAGGQGGRAALADEPGADPAIGEDGR